MKKSGAAVTSMAEGKALANVEKFGAALTGMANGNFVLKI